MPNLKSHIRLRLLTLRVNFTQRREIILREYFDLYKTGSKFRTLLDKDENFTDNYILTWGEAIESITKNIDQEKIEFDKMCLQLQNSLETHSCPMYLAITPANTCRLEEDKINEQFQTIKKKSHSLQKKIDFFDSWLQKRLATRNEIKKLFFKYSQYRQKYQVLIKDYESITAEIDDFNFNPEDLLFKSFIHENALNLRLEAQALILYSAGIKKINLTAISLYKAITESSVTAAIGKFSTELEELEQLSVIATNTYTKIKDTLVALKLLYTLNSNFKSLVETIDSNTTLGSINSTDVYKKNNLEQLLAIVIYCKDYTDQLVEMKKSSISATKFSSLSSSINEKIDEYIKHLDKVSQKASSIHKEIKTSACRLEDFLNKITLQIRNLQEQMSIDNSMPTHVLVLFFELKLTNFLGELTSTTRIHANVIDDTNRKCIDNTEITLIKLKNICHVRHEEINRELSEKLKVIKEESQTNVDYLGIKFSELRSCHFGLLKKILECSIPSVTNSVLSLLTRLGFNVECK
ncbi:MAG: hypothetical protein HOI53_02070 [Francisellaceae bacterium]|nr:hypothetical protein [Francisellaceae bacterium]MBT6325868.1 hypothetical protein [Bdellovibrionales bacterium]